MKKSLITEDLVFPNIGKDQKMQTVGCCIKYNTSSYEYDPDDRHKLQRMSFILLKNVKNAWLIIQRKSRKCKNQSKSLFIPRALNEGNNQIYKNYLPMLKKMKIWSFINLNIPINSINGSKFIEIINKLSINKKNQAFQTIKRYKQNHQFQQQKKINQIHYKSNSYQLRSKRLNNYQNSGSNQIKFHDGPININFQTLYLSSKNKTYKIQTNHRQSNTKKKQKNIYNLRKELNLKEITYQKPLKNYQQNQYNNFLQSKIKKEKARSNKYALNEQESCYFCSIMSQFEQKRKSQMKTAQTFFQDYGQY